jgi:hypothetical protein
LLTLRVFIDILFLYVFFLKIHLGTNLTPDHVMLGRVAPIRSGANANATIEELLEDEGLNVDKKSSTFKNVDYSAITLKKNAGNVVRSLLTSSLEGARKWRVTTNKICKVGKGNKLSSSHAQKTTIGELRCEEDMPVSVTGRTPGLLFNTMGIPSRMTVGHLMEPLAGEVATEIVERINATPWDDSSRLALKAFEIAKRVAKEDYEFLRNSGTNCTGDVDLDELDDEDNRIEELANALKHRGFNKWAEEEFINGETGELMGIQGCKGRRAGLVFRGKMFYYILTHRAEDKLHARHTGPRHSLTRQPIDGGSRYGGYRLGEMERDCFGEDTRVLTDQGFLSLSQIESLPTPPLYACYDVGKSQIVYCKGSLVLPVEPATELLSFTSTHEQARWTEESGEYGNNDKEEKSDRTNHLSIRVTKNHKMYVQVGTINSQDSPRWVETKGKPAPPKVVTASEILQDEKHPYIKFIGCAVDGIALPTEKKDTIETLLCPLGVVGGVQIQAFLEIYGFWLGDGSLAYGKKDRMRGDSYYCYAMVFNQKKKDDLEWLKQKFSEAGLIFKRDWLEGKEKAGDSTVNLYIIKSKWVEFIGNEYYSKYKHGVPSGSMSITTIDDNTDIIEIPRDCAKSVKWLAWWVLKVLDKSRLRLLIEALRRADGAFKNGGNNSIYTSGVQFRDQLIVALLHAGYSAFFDVQHEPEQIKGYTTRGAHTKQ